MTIEQAALHAIWQGPKEMLAFLGDHAGKGPVGPFYRLRGDYQVKDLSFSLATRDALLMTVVDVALGKSATDEEVLRRERCSWRLEDLIGCRPRKSRAKPKPEPDQGAIFEVLGATTEIPKLDRTVSTREISLATLLTEVH